MAEAIYINGGTILISEKKAYAFCGYEGSDVLADEVLSAIGLAPERCEINMVNGWDEVDAAVESATADEPITSAFILNAAGDLEEIAQN